MKSQLDLGVLFTGKLDASFDANIKRIQNALGSLQGTTAKVTQQNTKQAASWNFASKSLQGYIKDVEKFLAIQARWYGAKAVLFAAVDVPMKMLKSGIDQLLKVDSAFAKLKRYDAMMGDFSQSSKEAAESVIELARALNLKYPIPFDDIIKSADRLRAAGVEITTVRGILEEFVRFQTAWPEVEMEKFTNAVVGMMNTFRKTTGLKELANDAERYKAILDKLTVALGIGVIAPKDVNLVMQHFGQMAQSIGLSVDQMMAMSVLVTNLGAKAGPAARALAGVATSLVQPDKLALLQKVGIQIDKNIPLGKQFVTILEKIRNIVGTGESGLSVGASSFLGQLVPVERQKAFLAVLRDLDIYNELVKEISKSQDANKNASDEMNKTLENQIELFKKWVAEVSMLPMNATAAGNAIWFLIGIVKLAGAVLIGWTTIIKSVWLAIKYLTVNLYVLSEALMDIFRLDFKGAAQRFVDAWRWGVEENNKILEQHNKDWARLTGETFTIAPELKVGKKDLGGPLPSPTIPGTEKYPSLIASEKTYLNQRLAIYTSHAKTFTNQLKNLYSNNLIDEDYYNKMTVWNAEDTYQKKLEIINQQRNEVEDLYKKAIKDEGYAKDAEKRRAIEEQRRTDLEKFRRQEIEAFDEKERTIEDNRHDRVVKYIEREKNLRESNYALRIVAINKEKELQAASITEQQKDTEWLYENKRMNVREYYSSLLSYLEDNKRAERKALDDTFAAFLNKNVLEEINAKENKDEKAKIQQEFALETENYLRNVQNLEISTNAQITELYRKRARDIEYIYGKSGVTGVLKKFLDDITYDFESYGQRWTSVFEGIASGMSQTFEDAFFDVMELNLKSLNDYFTSFLTSVRRSLAKFLADEVVMHFLKAFGASYFGMGGGGATATGTTGYGSSANAAVYSNYSVGGVFSQRLHRGTAHPGATSVPSWLFDFAPRLHSGLRPGEFPAILENGETVTPRGGSNVEVNVFNQTGKQVDVNKKVEFDAGKMVIGIVLKDVETGGPLSGLFRGRK